MSIQVINISKTFSNGTKALKNVSMEFKKNKITGLIGFNGSGKTTTFNILTKFIEMFKGKVLIDNKPFSQQVFKRISYLSAGSEPKNPTKVISHLNSIGFIYGLSKKQVMEKALKISELIDFKQFLNNPIKSLSKGNQQKIKLIASLLNPKLEILFLDEPFDGLDPIMVNKIKKILMDLKDTTIIITSHRMDVVQSMCDEFYVLKNGVVVDKRKTSIEITIVAVNKETNLSGISSLPYVKKINILEKEKLIFITSIEHFKDLTRKLIDKKGYIYSSIKEQNIADSVFGVYS